MTNRTVHELHNESGTIIVTDNYPEGDPDEGYGPCINHEKCGNNKSWETGIHQFCKPCYQKWASAWFKGSSEEE